MKDEMMESMIPENPLLVNDGQGGAGLPRAPAGDSEDALTKIPLQTVSASTSSALGELKTLTGLLLLSAHLEHDLPASALHPNQV